jgi:hypothetical protein
VKPRHRTLALALPLFLTPCAGSGDNGSISAPGVLGNGGPTVPPMEAATMSDPSDFLEQLACDGPGDFLHCVGAKHRQTPGEVAKYRRHDLPAPAGYQIGDCVAGSCIFSYPPFGPFAVAKGDGGDHYQVDGGWVRIDLTQDGGKPGVLQHFVGPTCGGDGWVLFRQDAPTGHWTEMDARLANTDDGHCPSRLGHAYTRWRPEDVQWTFYFGTTREQLTLPTVVSEHYNRSSIAEATALERFYFAKGVGRVRWSAWNKTGMHTDTARCPAVPYDEAPDASGWALADCRTWTAIEPPGDATWTASRFGWPAS